MNIYEIRDLALKSGRAVYTAQQLANLINKPKSIATVYVQRLVRKGLAKKIVRGKISFSEDDAVIAGQLVEPSYISFYSALAFHRLVKQVPRNTECATTKRSIRYGSLGIVYHRIPPSLFYGYERHAKALGYVFVAEAEKALVDSVYLNAIPRNLAKEISSGLDMAKLKGYIGRFKGRGRKKLERWLL
ncbi:hypothetical protein H0O00_05725 [Candidatus Micrarchaeota archaeon]|nr:hypothetical protein [Candidatus Micrarchaeota archaeon]